MKEFTEDTKKNSADENEGRSVEFRQEDLVHSDNALKGLVPQGANHFNPIDEEVDQDEEELDEELEDDLDEMDEDSDQEINNNNDNDDPDERGKGDQSDIPLEFPERGPDRNYTTPV